MMLNVSKHFTFYKKLLPLSPFMRYNFLSLGGFSGVGLHNLFYTRRLHQSLLTRFSLHYIRVNDAPFSALAGKWRYMSKRSR
ncbi:MAG: hypothetical protein K0U39_07025 [Alphaproteobacteria bacterium]|nr:hypothetical protein [Alphaproteobacteria bacterium]